jgi:uncharacterized protein
MAHNCLTLTIVYGHPHQQTLITCAVAPGTTAREAIEQSGILALWPEIDRSNLNIGVFSKKVTADTLVKDGDRIELYRPLKIDPKEARKLRALKK